MRVFVCVCVCLHACVFVSYSLCVWLIARQQWVWSKLSILQISNAEWDGINAWMGIEGNVRLENEASECSFVGSSNSRGFFRFIFGGRTINDLSSLHTLVLLPAFSLPPCVHTFTHSFIPQKKGNSHRKTHHTKINFEGCFYCFFPHRRFSNTVRVLVFIFSYSSMWAKCFVNVRLLCTAPHTHRKRERSTYTYIYLYMYCYRTLQCVVFLAHCIN